MEWHDIVTAPKDAYKRDGSQYGPRILVTDGHNVTCAHWWQSLDIDPKRFRNFIDDGGNAFRPTHWMPLPPPPTSSPTNQGDVTASPGKVSQ